MVGWLIIDGDDAGQGPAPLHAVIHHSVTEMRV